MFDDETECSKTCDQDFNDDTLKVVDVCGLSMDSGPCRMSKAMFAFNSDTKRCEKFFYGGTVLQCCQIENQQSTVYIIDFLYSRCPDGC